MWFDRELDCTSLTQWLPIVAAEVTDRPSHNSTTRSRVKWRAFEIKREPQRRASERCHAAWAPRERETRKLDRPQMTSQGLIRTERRKRGELVRLGCLWKRKRIQGGAGGQNGGTSKSNSTQPCVRTPAPPPVERNPTVNKWKIPRIPLRVGSGVQSPMWRCSSIPRVDIESGFTFIDY